MKIKFLKIIMRHRALRISFLLVILFLIFLIVILSFNRAFKSKIELNQQEIDIVRQKLHALENLLQKPQEDLPEVSQTMIQKQLAPYETIIPFIALLEEIFGIIDSQSQITIKNEEAQIFINRYADYEVRIQIGDKKDLFFQALDEIHNGKFLTEIIQLNLNYALENNIEDAKKDELESAHLTIRLFFE